MNTKRKKHYFSSWLNIPALIERIIYFPKKKHPNYEKTRKCDFIFDQTFIAWIEEENKPETYELENWILYLKNHCSRISNRINFLLVYVAMTGVIASIFKITNMDKIALIILSIGLLVMEWGRL